MQTCFNGILFPPFPFLFNKHTQPNSLILKHIRHTQTHTQKSNTKDIHSMLSVSRLRLTLTGGGLSKIPFLHNTVLQSVFSAPPNKLAISVEQPGLAVQQYTYGDLQKDVLDVAMRAISPVVCNGDVTLETLMRKPLVASPFHPKMKGGLPLEKVVDSGEFNAGIMTRPNYEFVVSLLAQWSMNLMSVPMCHAHHFDTELTHVLGHSRMRLLMADAICKASKLPPAFTDASHEASRSNTFDVKCTLDVSEALQLLRQHRDQGGWELQLLPPEKMRAALATADDVLARIADLEEEKEEAVRQESIAEAKRLFRGYMMPPDTSTANAGTTVYKEHFDYIATIPGALELLQLSHKYASRDADCLMVYTSGTTNKPKGVVHTHRSVNNQIEILQSSWKWQRDDVILNVLPMHHVHGLINVTLCSLASQAHCVFTPFDNAHRIAKRLEKGDITLFMGVPTIYSKLDNVVRTKMSAVEQQAWKKSVSQNIRLMVSGSAALPVPVLDAWRDLSGHTLLERYGMTEIGMALSQPLRPLEKRVPGTVGQPLPTVRAYCDESERSHSGDASSVPNRDAAPCVDPNESTGGLMINSPSVFNRYWNNPEATVKEIYYHPETKEAFFKTGDTVKVIKDQGLFSILGRSSVDIIKHNGYKLSALEIEAELLKCEGVHEVAVVGVQHPIAGEEVCAMLVVEDNDASWIPRIKESIRERLASYKAPTRFVLVPDCIPRNAMGKINKKELKRSYNLD